MDESSELERLALEFCHRESKSIEKLCKLLTRRCGAQRAQLMEDAYHEALRVAPMIMNTYNSSMGASLRTHMLGNMRWYIWKMLKKGAKRAVARGELRDSIGVTDNTTELLARDQVESLLSRLPEAQAELLKWRFIDELSLDEIGELLDCARSTACTFVKAAINAAREASR